MEYQEYIKDKNPILTCEHLSKTFISKDKKKTVEHKVVDDLSLSIFEHEFVVLFGPGECGKTTTLNMLAGLDTADFGTVYQHGKEVVKPGIERGVVYQSVSLFPWLTVMGNVEFGPKARGIDKKTRRKYAKELITLVGLQGFENNYPNSLSGGMRQRVGIARAYANDPEVLFMDEPFGALDAQTRYLMQEEILRIYEHQRRTVVFVTNNIEEAVYLADRIIVMRSCPTSVKKEYIINIPRPREYTSKDFLRIRQEITQQMDKVL